MLLTALFHCYLVVRGLSSEVGCPKISEDCPKLLRRKDELFRTFSGHFPKIPEDSRRQLKISEEGPMMFRSYSNTPNYFLRDYVTIAMVIFLVTMATPISSYVKDKNSIFTPCDEDMIFLVKGKIIVFLRCLCN